MRRRRPHSDWPSATAVARLLKRSTSFADHGFGHDDELDGALLLAGYVTRFSEGRHCFQTTYLGERFREYFDHDDFRLIFILREPLAGQSAICPVSADTCMWILSPQRAVDALIHAMELPAQRWGWNRTLNAPGITVSVAQALETLQSVAGSKATALVRFERDPAIERIVLSWPARFETTRAIRLGFQADGGIEDIIRAHLQS